MQQNFAAALSAVLKSEGGQVDDPADPGGKTDFGITQATFDAWLRKHGDAVRDVATIAPDEVAAIYRAEYWDRIAGDSLPPGIDLALFDYAVNSGVARAVITLQEIVGTAPDGKIGPLTLAAVGKEQPTFLITKLCAMRLNFMQKLSTWPHFGAGWSKRVAAVEQTALKMVRPA